MSREFIEIELFEKTWKAMKLTDDELRELQSFLMSNPTAGPIIQGSGGARKMRFAFRGKGKSGSGRIIYVDYAVGDHIYLIMAYPKNKQETLSDAQKKTAQELTSMIREEEYRHGTRKKLF